MVLPKYATIIVFWKHFNDAEIYICVVTTVPEFGGIYVKDAVVFRGSEQNGYGYLQSPLLMSFVAVAGIVPFSDGGDGGDGHSRDGDGYGDSHGVMVGVTVMMYGNMQCMQHTKHHQLRQGKMVRLY